MRMFLRHFLLAALPLVCGIGAGYGFAMQQHSCTALVGPIFAAKCHGRQLEYQLLFQIVGTAVGTVLAALIGVALEVRRRRTVQPSAQAGF